MMNTDILIYRIRAFAIENKWKKSRLAKEAGLGDTTLRNFDSDRWNPTISVLRQIENIIPDDFTPSDSQQTAA